MAFQGAERHLPPEIPPPQPGSVFIPTPAALAPEDFGSPPGRSMSTGFIRRCLDLLLGLYFLTHIPITLCLDLQVVLPREFYWVKVRSVRWVPARWTPEFETPRCAAVVLWRPIEPPLARRGGARL